MSAVAVVRGQVRQLRENRKRTEPGVPPGEVWGRTASVLTEAGGILGDTVRVTLFNSDAGVQILPGDEVAWVVELTVDPKYGLQATYKAALDGDSLDLLDVDLVGA